MATEFDPIPVPFSQKVREFRHRAVPVLVFLMVSVLVFYLWDMRVHSPGFVGKVVADSSLVTSPYNGKINHFYLKPFDQIRQGEPVATIVRADSGYFQARLALISSQIRQVETGMEPVINHQRNIIDYENLRLDNLQTRIEVASLRIREQQLQAEYARAKELFESRGISRSEFELIESEYQVVKSEVEEKEKLTQELSLRLAEIEKYVVGDDASTPLSAAIDVYEKELKVVEEELKPVLIFAPISGVISKVFKGNGEYAEAGDQLIKIEATEPAYIVGYIRQPFNVEPTEGMEVTVRTRKPERSFFESNIMKIGGHIEFIEMGLRRPGIDQESGIPVQIAIRNTGDIKLYPGEFVDVILHP